MPAKLVFICNYLQLPSHVVYADKIMDNQNFV